MEWLDQGGTSLIGQAITFQPSTKLQRDWDIGLALPVDGVKIQRSVAERPVRIAVGKIVYYDDRDRTDRIEWGCRGTGCDRVMAVSSQYVLFIDQPPTCINFEGTALKPRVSSGYHYFTLVGGQYREMPTGDPMNFTLTDMAPADSDPTASLQVFTRSLFTFWASFTPGC
jgi:hypothetical protein